jgi:hypothetical protein
MKINPFHPQDPAVFKWMAVGKMLLTFWKEALCLIPYLMQGSSTVPRYTYCLRDPRALSADLRVSACSCHFLIT